MNTKAIATLHDGTKVRGCLTTEHPASSFGQPVFADDNGQAIDWVSIISISTAAQMGSAPKGDTSRENGRKGGRPRKAG